MDSADLSGVTGTPTFFVNGKRHHGAYDINTLTEAVRAAKTEALISSAQAAPAHILTSSANGGAECPSRQSQAITPGVRAAATTSTTPVETCCRSGARSV